MLSAQISEPRLHGQFSLPSGITAVVGLSGSGKTSLFRLMTGLDAGAGISMTTNGESVACRPPYDRPIRYVPQRPSLIPHRTIAAQVQWVQRVPDADVMAWREILQLERLWDRKPRQLSGGEQQRAALMRALAANPAILLLDEAVSNIDRPHRETIWAALRERRRPDQLILFSTHEWSEAESWADGILYMEEGVIHPWQPRPEVQPLTPTMARLMGYVGALPWNRAGQWLWLHPSLIEAGLLEDVEIALPGTLTVTPLSPLRAQYRFHVDGQPPIEWTGPPKPHATYAGISITRPVMTDFGGLMS